MRRDWWCRALRSGAWAQPVGLNRYVASGISKLGMREMTTAGWPWPLICVGDE